MSITVQIIVRIIIQSIITRSVIGSSSSVTVTIICPGYVQTGIARNALQGDGAARGTDDPSVQGGIQPAAMAARIHKAATRGEREVYFGGKEILAIYIKRYTPGFGAWLLSKVYPPES